MGRTLLGEMVDYRGRNGGIGFVRAEANDRSKVLCQLCNVAVVNALGLARDECMELVSVYG